MAELLKQEGNKVEFKVSVAQAEVSRAYAQVWSALTRDVRVPGFRPGKAPKSVIEKRVGVGYVENEVRDRLLQTHYPQAVRDLKLNLVDAQIDPGGLKDGQNFDFTVSGETYPKVALADWKGFAVAGAAPEITDEVMERTLGDLQERNATFEAVERPIEATDMVTIEELSDSESEGDQGDEAGGSYPIYLDAAEAHVRDALVGKSKGDEVTITVPAHSHGDHEHPEHSVRVRVADVKHKQLQALDDDFAGSLNFDSLDKLRADLRAELERRAQQEGDNARREAFVEQLTGSMTVDIPASMLERRRDAMLSEIKDDLSRQGVKWDEYEKFMQEQDKLDEFMNDLSKNAETRVKRDLALEQLAEDMGVQISDQEFNGSLAALAQANRLTVQELRNQLGPDGLNGYYASMMRDKALAQAVAGLAPATQASAASPEPGAEAGGPEGSAETTQVAEDVADQVGAEPVQAEGAEDVEAPKAKRASKKKVDAAEPAGEDDEAVEASATDAGDEGTAEKPKAKRASRKKADATEDAAETEETSDTE